MSIACIDWEKICSYTINRATHFGLRGCRNNTYSVKIESTSHIVENEIERTHIFDGVKLII